MGDQPVRILSDSCVDLDASLLKKLEVECVPLTVTFGDQSFRDGVDISQEEFYRRIRSERAMPRTSQISPAAYTEVFRRLTADGAEVVYIGLSSGLSGSYQSSTVAAAEFEGRVHVVDSLGASVGQGLMVMRAVELARSGMSAAGIAAEIEAYRAQICHVFTLDTLEFAHRGGRVSTVAAVASKLLDVKAVLHVDMAGKLVPFDRVRGRKRSISRLFEQLERLGAQVEGKRVGISHADAADEAGEMADRFRSKYGAAEVVVGQIGSTIGAHVGPGCVAIFFEGPAGRGA